MQFKLLIVDDEPINLSLLRQVLGDDYELFFARNGEEAIERAHQCQPDIILLDVMMPVMSGIDVCSILKNDPTLRDSPIILITALTDELTEERGFSAGAVDYITKPFSPALVKARVKTQLSLHHQRKTLQEMVKSRTRELELSQLGAVRMLGRAAEYKDNETGLHVIRMSHYSQILALACGFSQERADLILNAAPMHDIGKIGIPDSILRKPGALDTTEWKHMQRHPIIGAKIIDTQIENGSDSPLFITAKIISESHHEKWDGSGYPHGVAGSEIPIEGRIVAIADVFDALTSERPYKKAWSIEKSVELLKSESGKHFDPKLVSLFLEKMPEILQIKSRWNE